jgi:hypothetical protein
LTSTEIGTGKVPRRRFAAEGRIGGSEEKTLDQRRGKDTRSEDKRMAVRQREQNLVLAHVVENDGTLVVTQLSAPALRNLRNLFSSLLGSAFSLLLWYLLFPQAVNSWFRGWLTGPYAVTPAGLIFFLSLPFLIVLAQSVNRLFGREAFVFDRNEGVFIRNGYTVGPRRDIRAVRAQVTDGGGQYPVFRLILEMPRCETVTLMSTHDIMASGGFHLSGNGFGDPNKRFAAFTPWLNYDEQNLVPFLPPEIVELRLRILEFIGEATRKEN